MKHDFVAVGGTFDHLHEGHKSLLKKAVHVAKHLVIGITDQDFPKKPDQSYGDRLKGVEDYLSTLETVPYEFVPLKDPFGPSITREELDTIVVSEETYQRALEINKIRSEKRLKPLKIITVPMVRDEGGTIISSSLIRIKEVNK